MGSAATGSTARTGIGEKARRALETAHAPGLVLYTITLVFQLPGAFARGLIVEITMGIAALLTGWSIPVQSMATVAAFGPLAVSLLAAICPPLVCPIAGRWWEMSSGGRSPEQDELEAFGDAIDILRVEDENVRPPRHWFVAEDPGLNAAVYANSLRVDRGVLESPAEGPAVISHELEHLRSGDGRLTCALQLQLLKETETPEIRPVWSLPFRGLVWFASGQAALWFLANAWETYWRSREYAADEYTVSVGQGQAFARTLERDSLPYERPIRRMRFSMATHPYTKPRMTRLEAPPNPPATDQPTLPEAGEQ